jgi:hypothetical protein
MDKADLKQDKKMIAGAVINKHEKSMHPGMKPVTYGQKGRRNRQSYACCWS